MLAASGNDNSHPSPFEGLAGFRAEPVELADEEHVVRAEASSEVKLGLEPSLTSEVRLSCTDKYHR